MKNPKMASEATAAIAKLVPNEDQQDEFFSLLGTYTPDEAVGVFTKRHPKYAKIGVELRDLGQKKMFHESLQVNEMAASKYFTSGGAKSRQAKELVATFRKGQETYEIPNGPTFTAKKTVKADDLAKGMLVLASYSSTNQGAQVYEILGFTDDDKKYGEGGVKFNSARELYKAKKVTNLKDLEALQNKNEYGMHSYMVVRDIEDKEEGAWFYPFKGKWSRGSGAEALTFTLVEPTKTVKESLKEGLWYIVDGDSKKIVSGPYPSQGKGEQVLRANNPDKDDYEVMSSEQVKIQGYSESQEAGEFQLLNELLNLMEFETPGLKLGSLKYDSDERKIYVTIGDTKYVYAPHNAGTAPELFNSVTGMAKHSTGRALAYLKKHAKGVKINEEKA